MPCYIAVVLLFTAEVLSKFMSGSSLGRPISSTKLGTVRAIYDLEPQRANLSGFHCQNALEHVGALGMLEH